jgi:hypothetical protein
LPEKYLASLCEASFDGTELEEKEKISHSQKIFIFSIFQLSFVSPSLFSLHDKGTGLENLTSLPNLVKGFSGRDQQEWLNLIMEAANVNEQAKKIDQVRS